MKATIRKSVFVALMLGTLTAYATGVVERNRMEGEITLNNVKKGQHWFIKNSAGKIIHEEEIKSNGSFNQDFDFTSLKNGLYTLEVNKSFQIDVTPFTIISDEVIFHKKAEKVIFKPVIRTEENKILITKLHFEATDLKIVIYYGDEIIYKDTVVGNNLLKRVYALQKDKKGGYKVILKANDREYVKEFSL